MNGKIFRKNSIDKVFSPEQLDNYIRVSGPGVWMALAAIIIFLAGVCIWGIFGRLDTVVHAAGECRNGMLTCYVGEEDISDVFVGMEILADGVWGTVTEIETVPVEVTEGMDSWLLHLGGLDTGDWIYFVRAEADIDDGVYEVRMQAESVSPASFVWN